MIKKIGVENFRVFKDYTEFEIRPITLLVGPNNSGKSSFTKLLLLLKNGIEKLNFEEGIHNLESFDKVLNWDSDSTVLKLRFENYIKFLGDSYSTVCIYKRNRLMSLRLMNESKKPLLNITYNLGTMNKSGDYNYDEIQIVELDIIQYIDLFYTKNIQVPVWQNNKKGSDISHYIPLKEINKSDKFKSISLNEFKQNFSEFSRLGHIAATDTIRSIALSNEIDLLKKNYLLYKVLNNKENITDLYQEELLSLQIELFGKTQFNYSIGDESYDFFKMITHAFKNVKGRVKMKIEEHFKSLLNSDKITVEVSELGNLILDEKLYDDDLMYALPYQASIFEKLSDLKGYSNRINNELKDLHYLSANRGNQKRIYHNSSNVDIDEIVMNFSKIKNPHLKFLTQSLEILGLKGELSVERYENYISVLYIRDGDKKTSLADLGFGYSQLLPVLIKITNLLGEDNSLEDELEIDNRLWDLISMGYYSPKTLIIEEPEANLHPNLQSKLADILKLALEYNISFIVETHSEYLIRKLQYLTGKGELKTKDTIVHYFNDDEYVNNEEPKVKHIEISGTGTLSDTFGPGFYDEAIKLKFDLLNIGKEQNN